MQDHDSTKTSARKGRSVRRGAIAAAVALCCVIGIGTAFAATNAASPQGAADTSSAAGSSIQTVAADNPAATADGNEAAAAAEAAAQNGGITMLDTPAVIDGDSTQTDDSVCKLVKDGEVDATYYDTIAEALEAVEDSETYIITLVKDEITEDVRIGSDKVIMLDLNGCTLTDDGNEQAEETTGSYKATVVNEGTLTITDSSDEGDGTIDAVTHQCAALSNDIDAECNIEAGNLTRSEEAGTSSSAGNNSYYTVCNEGTMTIGEAEADDELINLSNNGVYSSAIENGFYNGKTEDIEGKAATLTINSGTFIGGKYTVKSDDYSVLIINGGTFTNTAETAGCILSWNDTTVNGGTFHATNCVFVEPQSSAAADEMDSGSIAVTGGTFVSDAGTIFGHTSGVSDEDLLTEIGVTGGNFYAWDSETETASRADVSEYLPDGYTQDPDGKIIDDAVCELEAVSSGEKTGYTSIADALEAAEEGDTVKLVQDEITEDVHVASDKNVTLDLNGCALTDDGNEEAEDTTRSYKATVVNEGTLTITDSDEENIGYIGSEFKSCAALSNDIDATCTIEKGAFATLANEEEHEGVTPYYTICNEGTMTIGEEGSFTSVTDPDNFDPDDIDPDEFDVIVYNSGNSSSMIENGFYNPSTEDTENKEANLTINGGLFYGGLYNVKSDDYGVLTVNGGYFFNETDNAGCILAWDSVAITDGFFYATSSVFVEATYATSEMEQGTIEVSGGTFVCESGEIFGQAYTSTIMSGVSVSGGSFYAIDEETQELVRADVSAYVPDGYTQDESGKIIDDAVCVVETASGEKTGYTSLADAVAALADSEGTITMLTDVTLEDASVTIASGTITLDLAGYTITGVDDISATAIYVTGEASLTIKDSSEEETGKIAAGTSAVCVQGTATLTLESGTLGCTEETSSGAVRLVNNATFNMNGGTVSAIYYAIVILNSATLNMTGGTAIATEGFALAGNNTSEGNTTATISGGSLISEDACAIYWPQDGALTISGDTVVTGVDAAIEIRMGTLVIEGGTFTATGEKNDDLGSSGGSHSNGSAIVIDAEEYISHGTEEHALTVTITDGTFYSVNSHAIWVGDYEERTIEDEAISIEGGTFVCAEGVDCIGYTSKDGEEYGSDVNLGVAVSDGEFYSYDAETGTATKADVSKYLAEGKAQDKDGNIVDAKTFTDNAFTAKPASDTCTGSAIDVTVSGEDTEGTELVDGDDFTYAITDASGAPVEEVVDAGTYTVTITGIYVYAGSTATATFEIKQAAITEDMFTVDTADQTYTGNAITPSVTSTLQASDYTVAYSNNTEVGQATITITGQGNYTGTLTYNFNIVQGATPEEIAALQGDVTSAQAALSGVVVSKDGSDVATDAKWVTQDVYDAFAAAIASAEAVANSSNPSAAEVADASSALASALATFQAAEKSGTKSSGGSTKAKAKKQTIKAKAKVKVKAGKKLVIKVKGAKTKLVAKKINLGNKKTKKANKVKKFKVKTKGKKKVIVKLNKKAKKGKTYQFKVYAKASGDYAKSNVKTIKVKVK